MKPNLERICYSPMIPERHSARVVADLIHQSAPSLFSAMLGPRQRAVALLSTLVQRPHNRFSHRYIYVAEMDKRIVGMVVLVPAAQLKGAADHHQVYGPLQRLWLTLIQRLLLRHLLRHDYPAGSFYIGNVAVAPDYRDRGIGRQLLSWCIAEVGTADLFISVDVDNPRAQKLYESLGFKVVETNAIRVLTLTLGSHVLLRSPYSGIQKGSPICSW